MSNNPEIGAYVTANGIRTNYHDLGKGEPVLLIHGSGPGVTAYANWRLTMPGLAARFRVIAPDMVGFGEPERSPDYRYGMENWVEHGLGLLDVLGIERAHVVGNSFGGARAYHPSRNESASWYSWAVSACPSRSPRGWTPSGATSRRWTTCAPCWTSSPTIGV